MGLIKGAFLWSERFLLLALHWQPKPWWHAAGDSVFVQFSLSFSPSFYLFTLSLCVCVYMYIPSCLSVWVCACLISLPCMHKYVYPRMEAALSTSVFFE